MKNKILFAFIGFAALTTVQPTAASQGLEVRPAGRELFQTEPRQIVSTTFRITNNTADSLELISTTELPDGWILITDDFPLDLAANESTTKILSFFVPETTPAGKYKISYIVSSRKYPSIRDFYTIDLVVLPCSKLEAKLAETPEYISSRECYRTCFSITNKSNKEHNVEVSVVSSDNMPFEMDKQTLTLAPWESQTVTVMVRTDPKPVRTLKHHLQLTAQIIDEGKPEGEAKAVSTMEIPPSSDDRRPLDKQVQSPQNNPIKKQDNTQKSPFYSRFILGPKDTKESIQTEPKAVVTTVLAVTNPTDKTRQFVTEVELPENWNLITKDFPFELNPQQTDNRLLSFFVPQTTLAGNYEITYTVRDEQDPSLQDSCKMYILVVPVGKLQANLLESPKYVIAGEEYQSSFAVTNLGNTQYTVTAQVAGSENIPCTIDREQFTLSPGQSETVTVTVKTDPQIAILLKHRVQLTVEALEDAKIKAKAVAESIVDIVPNISGAEQPYHTIPTELTVRYVSQKNEERNSGIQTEIRGQGTLDEEGKHNIKFRAMGPDLQQKSILGERDEYTLSYWTDKYEMHFGDRSYSLSPLTENYLYGRGLEGRFNLDDNLSLGAYHMQTRWLQPGIEETGASLDYLINQKDKIGINYLRKQTDANSPAVNNIASLEAELKPFDNTDIELEYALGPGGAAKDNAYLTKFCGYNDWLRYYLNLTHAGPDYPGYYKDLDFISGGMSLPLTKRLNFNTSFRQQKNNLDLDPLFYSAPLEKHYECGVDYKLADNTSLSFDWLNQNRRDLLENPQFDYEENTFRLGLARSFKKISLYTSAEVGKTNNNLDDNSSKTERYTASVSFSPGSRQCYSGYLYYDKNSDFTGENKRSTTLGLNAQYQIADRTFLNFLLQTNDYEGSAQGGRDNFEARLSHIFTNGNRLSVVARHTVFENSNSKNDTALMVQYTIPLGLPVSRRKSIGSVKGHLYDQQTQNPIANAILRLNGSTAVTDKTGNFTFPSVRPGIYYLNVDTASIGMNRIPSRKTPIELAVQGGEKTSVDIPITLAARLSGRIMVYGYKNNYDKMSPARQLRDANELYVTANNSSNNTNAKLIEDHGLTNTIVELKSSSEIRRTVTDNQGCFEFEELRPGNWTLKIQPENLPDHQCLEQDTFDLQLKPGEKNQIDTKVLPKKRRIRMLAEAQTLIEERK